MARRRFFVDQVHHGKAEIRGENAHHLTRVLRVEAGQNYEISDNNRAWLARVESARKDLVRFELIEELPPTAESAAVVLYLALIKFERFEWAVEKATELGVTHIVPVDASRSEQGLFAGGQKRVERWRRIARESSEQSRRLRAPDVSNPARFAEALKDTSSHRIWLDEQRGAPALLKLLEGAPHDPVALMIGPEGGWTEAERTACSETGWQGASLGPSILRAETAVCAALAILAQLRSE